MAAPVFSRNAVNNQPEKRSAIGPIKIHHACSRNQAAEIQLAAA
jgi:hypothetical protein